ncbi:His Kinase A (phospho-acceptor) domain-containing protein [Lentzea waywayandensis]|uniref:histidine kinase n=1 Tax=Lentzea waywayandensis TaxID=84724 RepID=A0A1I6FEJ1_9PSEU|nr:sensor histidine kinase [Lentzea waywayandensis]SFR28308.1 His Kinase A (phospho-acceptor) domain-containing protein [Lentzea waywayandensis]
MNLPQRMPASRLLGAIVVVLLAMTAVAISSTVVALDALGDTRSRSVDKIEPAARRAQTLNRSLLDQETGVRGFTLTGQDAFLKPYLDGQAAQTEAARNVRDLVGDVNGRVTRIEDLARQWRSEYAEPTVAAIKVSGPAAGVAGDIERGKVVFDQLRSETAALQSDIGGLARQARADLDSAAKVVLWLVIGMGVLLVAVIGGLSLLLHRLLIAPLASLADHTRQVASGDFEHEIDADGPRETVMLGEDVNQMRRRIVQELATLAEAKAELQRSNSELEQFAYVASHDLQEPLRKVASFCQLLQRRYGGQLDERADQYIEFAVDGAKRMQVLINDLLAFSRVGRMSREQTVIDLNDLVRHVVDSFSERVEETGARLEIADLPSVRGEASLLSAVFQNLISNALKFKGAEAPVIAVDVVRDGEMWKFTVRDNGIGIEPEYADRIFVIFQRLHPKDAYPGTGIGLAMCRKIVEFHGGTIRLKTDVDSGTSFEFTLPVVAELAAEVEEVHV